MRIGLNLLYLLPGFSGGTETYAAGLLQGLSQIDRQNDFFVFVNQESALWSLPESPNFTRVVCPVSAASRVRRYFFEQMRFSRLVRKYNLDLLHSLGYVAPLNLDCKSVVSTLDIVYDSPGGYSFPKKQILEFLVNSAARKADHIVTISEVSRQQIVSRLNVPLEKVTVTLLAPRPRPSINETKAGDLTGRLGIHGKYLLALSSSSPNKNIPMLLRAYAGLPADVGGNLQLVLAGHEPLRGTSLRQLTETLNLRDRVVFSGYLADAELNLLLKGATAFVFPSLYEGFGLPLLEAMAVGVPVASSNAASLPEVAGEAALLFDPRSLDDVTTTLNRLLTDGPLRDDLKRKGFKNLERFSWKITAEKTLQVYRQVNTQTLDRTHVRMNDQRLSAGC